MVRWEVYTSVGNVKKISTFPLSLSSKKIRFFFIKNKLKDTPHSIKKEECLSQQPEGVGGLLGGVHNIGNFRFFTFSFLKRGDFSLFTCLVPLKTFRQQPEDVGGLLGRRCTQLGVSWPHHTTNPLHSSSGQSCTRLRRSISSGE